MVSVTETACKGSRMFFAVNQRYGKYGGKGGGRRGHNGSGAARAAPLDRRFPYQN